MATYTVRQGDSPFSIAQRFAGDPRRMSELVSVNPRKPRHLIGNAMTFKSLQAGERINLPNNWLSTGFIGDPQGLGDPIIVPRPIIGPPPAPNGGWAQMSTATADSLGAAPWGGYFCGPAGDQAGVQMYRSKYGVIYASSGPSVNYPESDIPRTGWQWTGPGPITSISQLPVLPGLPCVTPQYVPQNYGATTAPTGGGGGGGYYQPPTRPTGPQRLMGIGDPQGLGDAASDSAILAINDAITDNFSIARGQITAGDVATDDPTAVDDYVQGATAVITALAGVTASIATLVGEDPGLATPQAAYTAAVAAANAAQPSATDDRATAQTAANATLASGAGAFAAAGPIATAFTASASGGGTTTTTLAALAAAVVADGTICTGTPPIASVAAFQTAAGLKVDGEYGPTTAVAVSAANGGTAPAGCAQYAGGGSTSTGLTIQVLSLDDAYANMTADESLCTPGPNPDQTPTQSVLNFQAAYNTNLPAGATAIATDGIFGPATLAALNTAAAGYYTFSGGCANGTLAFTQPTTPPPGPSPVTRPGVLPTSSSSTTMAIVYGAGALLVAGGVFYYLTKTKGTHAGTHTAGKKHLTHIRHAARRRRR